VSAETKAVLFNAVPLFAVAAAYLAVAVAVAPRLWRQRAGLSANDLALGLMFPCIGIPAAILGGAVLDSRSAIGGHLWFAFAASLVALLPGLVFLARWGERDELLSSGARAREAEQLVSVRGRELEAVAAISEVLARTTDPEAAGRILLDEVGSALGIEFTALRRRHLVARRPNRSSQRAVRNRERLLPGRAGGRLRLLGLTAR